MGPRGASVEMGEEVVAVGASMACRVGAEVELTHGMIWLFGVHCSVGEKAEERPGLCWVNWSLDGGKEEEVSAASCCWKRSANCTIEFAYILKTGK